jgi:hypothetical protein
MIHISPSVLPHDTRGGSHISFHHAEKFTLTDNHTLLDTKHQEVLAENNISCAVLSVIQSQYLYIDSCNIIHENKHPANDEAYVIRQSNIPFLP